MSKTKNTEKASFTKHALKEAVVRVWEYHPEDERLVAYIVFRDQHSLTVTELRQFVSDILPIYIWGAIIYIKIHLTIY